MTSAPVMSMCRYVEYPISTDANGLFGLFGLLCQVSGLRLVVGMSIKCLRF
jgi:hypothetical protein